MIFTNKKTEEEVVLPINTLQEQIENIAHEKVERVKSFKDFGFKRAGQNLGESISLKNHLNWIKDGHIVEETFHDKEADLLRQQAENKILAKDEEKEKIEGEKRTAIEVTKPSVENKIRELNDEIQQTQIDLADKTIQTGYEPIKFIMYSSLVVILSFYLLFFYASTIYAAFFRNANSIIATSGKDIALFLDSIFDVKGIFTASPILIIVYLGAFLFFAIGLIPHNIEGKNKKIKIGIAVLVAFIADAMLAYKIDAGIHNLKVMAGVAEADWHFYSSINFYLVLLFGFCAYLVWGYLFELMLKEKAKKSHTNVASIIIKGLREEITVLRLELKDIETKIIELETQLKAILLKLEQLKRDLEKRMQNPDVLSQNLTSFYIGWNHWLNSTSEFELEKSKCDQTFNEFMNSQFTQVINQN
jgi:hypothetical protein